MKVKPLNCCTFTLIPHLQLNPALGGDSLTNWSLIIVHCCWVWNFWIRLFDAFKRQRFFASSFAFSLNFSLRLRDQKDEIHRTEPSSFRQDSEGWEGTYGCTSKVVFTQQYLNNSWLMVHSAIPQQFTVHSAVHSWLSSTSPSPSSTQLQFSKGGLWVRLARGSLCVGTIPTSVVTIPTSVGTIPTCVGATPRWTSLRYNILWCGTTATYLYICVFVYLCICVFVYLCTYLYMVWEDWGNWTRASWLCISLSIYLCVFVCLCICVFVYLCICVFVYLYMV